ncbi:MAG: DUF1549 domain-containing protein [Planctomycetaceae bacterium]
MVGSRLILFACAVFALPILADDVPGDSVQAVVDYYIEQRLTTDKIVPAELVDDVTWLRRVTLDLAGRIPSQSEVEQFRTDVRKNRREFVVDRLLNSPDYAYHERNVLDNLLQSQYDSDREWRAWLLRSIREGRSWQEMFRTIMSGTDENPDEQPALAFLKKRANDIDAMTNDASRLFFGVSINCAQCHDHPLVDDWKQDHYFGFKSFFARTYVTKNKLLAEKPPLQVKFKTTDGEDKVAPLMFLTGTVVEEPDDKRSDEQKKADDEAIQKQIRETDAPKPPRPSFSPRQKLVEAALSGENSRFFSRAMANRVWARFFDRGLVHPLDQLHSANPGSHPELLDWLEREFRSHNYNLRWLERGLVLSDTYARSSLWESEDSPPPELFAVATPRPLSPRQFALTVMLATTSPDAFNQWLTADAWPAKRRELEDRADGWRREFELPGESFSVSVDEALLFANSDRVMNDFLRDGSDKLVGCLLKTDSTDDAVTKAFATVLSREPDQEERAACLEFAAQRTQNRVDGLRNMVWALITSPELRFNH